MFFIALKAEVEQLGIKHLINVPTSLNNLKTKLDDLDVGKEVDDVVNKEVIKNTEFNILNKKLNNLEKKNLFQLILFT